MKKAEGQGGGLRRGLPFDGHGGCITCDVKDRGMEVVEEVAGQLAQGHSHLALGHCCLFRLVAWDLHRLRNSGFSIGCC